MPRRHGRCHRPRPAREGSPQAALLAGRAAELCERSSYRSSVAYARVLRWRNDIANSTDQFTYTLRDSDKALVVLAALDQSDAEVQAEFARCCSMRCYAHYGLGRSGEALLAARETLHRFELLGIDEGGIIQALCNAGMQLGIAGANAEALSYLSWGEARALAVPRGIAVYGAQLAQSASIMVCLLRHSGRADEALTVARRSHARLMKVPGRKCSLEMASSYLSHGDLLRDQEGTAGALTQYRSAECIFEERGWKDVIAAELHTALGLMARMQGRHHEALLRFERGLAIILQSYPADHYIVI